MDLCRDLDVGLGRQCETTSLPDAVAHEGDVLLEAAGVTGEAQHGASRLGQSSGLVLGAPRETGPQEVGDGGVAALLPTLRRREDVKRLKMCMFSPSGFL